jgi:hypothetical protein
MASKRMPEGTLRALEARADPSATASLAKEALTRANRIRTRLNYMKF